MTRMFLWTLIFAGWLAACGERANQPAVPGSISFYYWKTSLKFDRNDRALAGTLGVQRLYLRYFDVDWSPAREMAMPVSELSMNRGFETEGFIRSDRLQLQDYRIVPVIYLTNAVFQHDQNLDTLATRIARKITGISTGITEEMYPGWGGNYEDAEAPDGNWAGRDSLAALSRQAFLTENSEVQIDCDWTPGTRMKYFAFLNALKQALPGKTLTCTVRLHQFRDREQAGIPPVSAATLMCYNVAPPTELKTANAIFDPALVEGYLKEKDYPLPLEAALPLFSWGALFHENQFRGLAGGLTEAQVKDDPLFKAAGEGRYQFMQDTVYSEVYMREGDVVRLDEPSQADLTRIAERLAKIKAVKSISFFDWNVSKIQDYDVPKIYEAFAKGH